MTAGTSTTGSCRDWLGHTNIAQTSTYLAGTIKTEHDAMRRFEERWTATLRRPAVPGVVAGTQPDTGNAHNE